ncbi:hypothetical protein GE061_007198 [Apolygus lucorum]|uniref:Cardioactive peptide n=1 Tax=Apolygus lucorum TaxID=248454 RepID=A0A8S9WRA7_APOLU|nr:hypothetical protein GE061_007198 [Apolygus lucorum]
MPSEMVSVRTCIKTLALLPSTSGCSPRGLTSLSANVALMQRYRVFESSHLLKRSSNPLVLHIPVHGVNMQLIYSCLLLPALFSVIYADDVILQKRYYYPGPGEVAEPLEPKMKKPFCNAFTGCGKKRSDESMAALVDLNSEPAVEDLSRQILSEAKLWEALQEARMELINRKHQGDRMQQLQPLPLTGIRKRSQYVYT